MTQRNPIAPGQGAESRVAEEHRLAREAYASAKRRRTIPNLSPSYAAASLTAICQAPEPSDLDVAILVAQRMLDSDSVLSVREALRLLLRALGAEPVAEQATQARCPAAHQQDPTPCSGPAVVTVLDRTNEGADGCAHHAARLLASIEGGRVYALPDAPGGAAIRVFKAADGIRPFPWLTDAPRTNPSQLSHEENRSRGDRQ